MMSRRWSSNLFCCTSALLSTMPSSCWWADRYDVTDRSFKKFRTSPLIFFETLKGFACCCFPCRGRWVCHWNSLTDWCDFTDPGCQQETASSRLKLSTPQGLRCSGLLDTDYSQLQSTIKPSVSNFTEQNLIQVCSATVCKTFISSMRSLALNGR